MGFMDETSTTGRQPILKWTKEAKCLQRGSDEPLNDQEFIADVRGARGGYLKFGEKDQPPERHMGSIFPKDEAPLRSSLGNTDKSEWAKGRFSDEPEDPWTATIRNPPCGIERPARSIHVRSHVEDRAGCREGPSGAGQAYPGRI